MAGEKTNVKGAEFPPLEKGRLRLYSMRFCPFAQRTRLVLAHKKIPFETVNVAIDPPRKPEWFLEKNPLGKVPILEQDGKIIYESGICNDYLDEVYPNDRLTPSDPYQKARDKILLEHYGKIINAYYSLLRNYVKGDKDLTQQYTRDFNDGLQLYENELKQRGNFFGGEKPMMLDFMVWPHLERLPSFPMLFEGISIAPEVTFPLLNAWMKRMLQREEVKMTMFDIEKHTEFLKGYASDNADYDIGL